MSTDKQIKKELKNLEKECKKKKNALAYICAMLIADDSEKKRFEEYKEKLKPRELLDKFEKNSHEIKKILFEKQNYKNLPSQLVKIQLAKEFVPELIENMKIDDAFFYLSQLEKVKDPDIMYFIGNVYELKGIINLAKDFYEKAKKAGNQKATEKLAEIYVKEGVYHKAAALFEEFGDYEKAATYYIKSKKIKEAEKLWDKVSESLKVNILEMITDADRVIALSKDLNHPRAKLKLASALITKGQLDKAMDIINELIGSNDQFVKIEALRLYCRNTEDPSKKATLLSPLYISGLLPDDLKFELAKSFVETKNESRAIKVLAELFTSDYRKHAKRLLKQIRDNTESKENKSIIEKILSEDSFIKRLKESLKKSRNNITFKIEEVLKGNKKLQAKTLSEIEEILISADVGVKATQKIIDNLKKRIERGEIRGSDGLIIALQEEILKILKPVQKSIEINDKPFVIMVVGVNGTGKTTTIAKLAYRFKKEGKKVLLAAADTFRAAAIEQLEIWANKIGVDIVKHKMKSDPSGVVFDATNAALSRDIDVVIIDTAGRLHTKVNLIEELKKIKRSAARNIKNAPHEVLLVLDAVMGQNAITQAKIFNEAVGVTGIVLTKMDSTAKGGIIIAVAEEFKIPIKYVGLGEKLEDLEVFNAEKFVEALFE